MNKKIITYIFMHVLFLSGSSHAMEEIEEYIPQECMYKYKYTADKKYFYPLDLNGGFSSNSLDMSEGADRLYHAKLLATNHGFFVQVSRMSKGSHSDSDITPHLTLLPIRATKKQKKTLLQELQNQDWEQNGYIIMTDNKQNSYKLTQLECNLASSSSSSSTSFHEEEKLNNNENKEEVEFSIEDKSELLTSTSRSFLEKSEQLKHWKDIYEQKQWHYMIGGAAIVITGAILLYKYKSLSS